MRWLLSAAAHQGDALDWGGTIVTIASTLVVCLAPDARSVSFADTSKFEVRTWAVARPEVRFTA